MSHNETNTTICAVSTPPGVGGIAVIRISGPEAVTIADSVWQGKRLADSLSHTAHLGNIIDPESPQTPLDQAVATLFRAPASFTGEDVVEFSVHGSTYIQQQLVNLLLRQGCTLAQPGEFTRRAFASGKLDLTEAEAVADLIASTSDATHRLAMNQMRGQFSRRLDSLRDELLQLAALMELELDFSEEEVEFADRTHLHNLASNTRDEIDRLCSTFATGDAIRNGIPVAIVGSPNVGKSSLLNALLADNRAIVSDIPGTTRDTIEDTVIINGVNFRFIDTAGIRLTDDTVENLGIERAWEKIAQARIILWVTTPDEPAEALFAYASRLATTREPSSALVILTNKIDLHPDAPDSHAPLPTPASASALPADSIADSPFSQKADRTAPAYASESPTDRDGHPSSSLSSDAAAPAYASGSPTDRDSHPSSAHNSDAAAFTSSLAPEAALRISVATGAGLDTLRDTLVRLSGADRLAADDVIVTNARHYEALRNASHTLSAVIAALQPDAYPPVPTDLIAQDLRETLHHLSTITGAITTPDILTHIFTRFCIGK